MTAGLAVWHLAQNLRGVANAKLAHAAAASVAAVFGAKEDGGRFRLDNTEEATIG
jgi:hypothetical protein